MPDQVEYRSSFITYRKSLFRASHPRVDYISSERTMEAGLARAQLERIMLPLEEEQWKD